MKQVSWYAAVSQASIHSDFRIFNRIRIRNACLILIIKGMLSVYASVGCDPNIVVYLSELCGIANRFPCIRKNIGGVVSASGISKAHSTWEFSLILCPEFGTDVIVVNAQDG